MTFLAAGIAAGAQLLSGGLNAAKANSQQRQANANAKKLTDYENKTDKLNWQYSKDLRDYQYNQSLQIYNKSKDVYQQQLGFNETAASRSYEAESRKMNEYMQGLAFNKQDLFIQMLQASGKANALGTSGNSTSRLQRDVLAQFGRDNATLAENLVSAKQQHVADLTDIGIQRQNADFDAFTKLGLKPIKAPLPPVPLKRPTTGASSNPLLTIGSVVTDALTAGYSAYNAKLG
jgi:hypothetical protein